MCAVDIISGDHGTVKGAAAVRFKPRAAAVLGAGYTFDMFHLAYTAQCEQ